MVTRGLAWSGSGATGSPRITAAYWVSPGSTTLARRFWSLYCGFVAGSIMIRAKVMPSSWRRPCSRRWRRAASLGSCGSSPSALSIMARKVALLMFQPLETPFSSSLPPATVKFCQSLRRAKGPSTTVS